MSVVLKHSPADVVRYLLIQLGLGTLPASSTTAWPVFVGLEPDSPDDVITIYDTQGRSDGREIRTGEVYHRYGFQVRVRSKDFDTGFDKVTAIQRSMAESVRLSEVAVAGTTYLVHAITGIGTVFSLGRESPTTRRRLFTLNAMVCLVALN